MVDSKCDQRRLPMVVNETRPACNAMHELFYSQCVGTEAGRRKFDLLIEFLAGAGGGWQQIL